MWRRLARILCFVAALAGCTAVGTQLHDAATTSLSAVETARLAVHLENVGKSTAAVASTALVDTLGVLIAADATVSGLDPPNRGDAASRRDVLTLIHNATDAVNAARQAVGGIGSLGDVEAGLRIVAKDLKEMALAGRVAG